MALILRDPRCAKCGEPITQITGFAKDSCSFVIFHPACYELRDPDLLTWYEEAVEMTREDIEKLWASAKFHTTGYDEAD